jgi:uncharacterized membrane protein YgdD (TMEM256/DUF423 family)
MLGCAGGFLAVAAGAFGAHALRGKLEPRMLDVFEVAVRYQMYHALALLAAGAIAARASGRRAAVAGSLFVAGTVLFSGSLYLVSVAGLRWMGAVTPLGGAALLAGWAALAAAAWRLPRSQA